MNAAEDTPVSGGADAGRGAGGSPDLVARVVPLAAGFYAFSLPARQFRPAPAAGLPLPAVQVCPVPRADRSDNVTFEITDDRGAAAAWLGGRTRTLLVKAPHGGAALVTAYLGADYRNSPPLEVEVRRLDIGYEPVPDAPAARPLPPLLTLRLGAEPPLGAPQSARLDIVAHIRGRGDVRFLNAAWAGRLGPGQWIEAFTVIPGEPEVAAAIEYKGLTASGNETPWLACGTPCGTRGRGTPLVGFAVRQKAGAGDARFDCEYSGYFQSGTTSDPARNGAPCRSERDNDPLEGLQLNIVPRPAPDGGTA